MCDIEYAEPSGFYRAITRRARKQHQCFECHRVIEPGESYEYVTGSWDRQISAFKTCAHCLAGRQWLLRWCGGFMHGNVLGETVDHWREWEVERTIDFGRLVVLAERKWHDLGGRLMASEDVAVAARKAYESTAKAMRRGLANAS